MTAGADLRLLRAAVFTVACVTLSAAGHSLTGGGRTPYWSLGVACAVVIVIALPLAGRERSLPGIAGLLAAGQIGLHTLFSCGPMPVTGAGGHGSAGHGTAHGGADLRDFAARLLCGEQSAAGISESRARRVIADAGIDPARLGSRAGSSMHGELAHHAAGHPSHHAAGHGAGSTGTMTSALDSPLECLRSAAHAAFSSIDVPMLLGHLLAALVLGWLLRRGETALWKVVRLSARSARSAVTHVRTLSTAVAHARAALTLRIGLLPDIPARTFFAGACEQRAPRSVLLHHSVHRRGPPQQERQESFALAA